MPSIELPPPPPPSPHYASSSQYHKKKKTKPYTEKDFEDIYYHFDDYAQDVILANASRFISPPEPAEHYEWEEVILDEASKDEWEGMKKSLYFGLGCGVVGFGMLRWRRRRGGGGFRGLSKYASSSKPKSSGGYTFDPIPPPPKPNNNAMQQNMQQQNYNSAYHQQSYNYNTHHGSSTGSSKTGLIIDVALSTILGLGASILALQTDIFYPTTLTISISNNSDDNMDEASSTATTTMDGTSITIGEVPPPPQWISSDIPLVPGRSMISETLCKPLTNEFRKFPKQLWQFGNNKGIENGYNNHIALYANPGWKGTKYYNGNENASLEMLGENGGGSSNDIPVSGGGIGEQQQGVYEHLVLDSLQGFIINCERRARQERKIRKIRGMKYSNAAADDATPVVISHDGVSADEDLTLDDIYLIEDGDE